jgi:hypothetical protein
MVNLTVRKIAEYFVILDFPAIPTSISYRGCTRNSLSPRTTMKKSMSIWPVLPLAIGLVNYTSHYWIFRNPTNFLGRYRFRTAIIRKRLRARMIYATSCYSRDLRESIIMVLHCCVQDRIQVIPGKHCLRAIIELVMSLCRI